MYKVILAFLLMIISATVVNAQPVIEFTEPSTGFFTQYEQFCVKISDKGVPAATNVIFQWAKAMEDTVCWHDFDAAADIGEPFCAELKDDYFADATEGFYFFRALVIDAVGVMHYSGHVALFYDATPLRAKLMMVATDNGLTFNVAEDPAPTPVIPADVEIITLTFFTSDDQSSWGPSPIYNSGLGAVCFENVCTDYTNDAKGEEKFSLDIGTYRHKGNLELQFDFIDAVGSNATSVTVSLFFE